MGVGWWLVRVRVRVRWSGDVEEEVIRDDLLSALLLMRLQLIVKSRESMTPRC